MSRAWAATMELQPGGALESRGRCRSWSKGHCKGDPRSPQHESAARVRLPRLRLARPETYFLVRVLREWGQSRCMGSDGQRTTPEFFATHTVGELWNWPDFDLENEGRLTHPLVYDQATDRYLPISWDLALARIGASMRGLPRPDMAEFYTSGRASNEAAFLYQLFAREYGTNNFPDCSNMCHEATSVGLPESIGVGKGTVTLEDFDHCDAVFCIRP